MDKKEVKYREQVEKREELNLLNDDPYGHFLKYVLPFLKPEDIEDVEEDLFDLGAFDEEKEEK